MSSDDLKHSFLWVNSFDEGDVKEFYSDFFSLESDPSIPVITVFIDSYGGTVEGLTAMRDLIKSSEKPVATVCVGKAMSAAASLLACGHKGLRFISKDSSVMIHEISSGFLGKNEEIKSVSRQTDKLNNILMKNLAEDMGKTKKQLENQLHKVRNADWYLTPTEAKKWGIVDHISIPRISHTNPTLMLKITQNKKRGKS